MLFYSDNCRMIFFFLCMLCFLRTMTIMAIYYFLAFFALRFSSLLTLLSVFYHPCKQNLSAVNSLFPSYFPPAFNLSCESCILFRHYELPELPTICDGNNRYPLSFYFPRNFLNIHTFSPCYVMSP